MGKIYQKEPEHHLSDQQILFCHEYMANGNNGKAAALKAGYSSKTSTQSIHELVRGRYVGAYLKKLKDNKIKDIALTYEWKLAKLERLIDLSIPDDAQTFKEVNGTWGVSAIGEANKMQGHYAPTNSYISCEIVDETAAIVEQIEEKNKKEF